MPAPTPKPPAKAPLPKQPPFYHRFLIAWTLAAGVILASLALGILGYHFIAGFIWVDALLNASMILSGMGPVGELHTHAAKIFASAYALFSGIIFISSAGIILSPVMHHVLHRFHLERKETE